ncbi:MAG: hypothetical protein ACI9VR_000045 [Cognaticolwellia sp.]|jgi:hypothetical protein
MNSVILLVNAVSLAKPVDLSADLGVTHYSRYTHSMSAVHTGIGFGIGPVGGRSGCLLRTGRVDPYLSLGWYRNVGNLSFQI